jgi:hypothetical protein
LDEDEEEGHLERAEKVREPEPKRERLFPGQRLVYPEVTRDESV